MLLRHTTDDKVYLLSEQEVTTAAYGFNADYNADNEARQKRYTDYAKACGVAPGNTSGYEQYCMGWSLRSTFATNSNLFRTVGAHGATRFDYDVTKTDIGVAPVIRLTVE